MPFWFWLISFCVALIIIFYQKASHYVGTLFIGVVLVLQTIFYHNSTVLAVEWLIFLVLAALINVPYLRRMIAKQIFPLIKAVRPKMSATEAQALHAGTVGFEGELFSGKPDFEKLLAIPKATLTQEEKDFLNGPVKELCSRICDFNITHKDGRIPNDMMSFIKDNKFFGMIIPKAYGGLEFSPYAHSQVIIKLGGKSVSVATTVSVPNSLGPAELLLHYGTQQQKDYYLPRLADGREIPCFALTSLYAGSDAAAMQDYGVICKGVFEGQEVLGIRLNWSKRYITLAPIATVLGLAFKCYDPEKLLGDQKDLGITCALIPADTAGVITGRRHFPLNAVFQNGPTQGKDVFIPMDYLIGGQAMIGHGWQMLMECLSAGRAISLPSMVMGGCKISALTSGAYARNRRQFDTAIGNFEGIQEQLAKMTAYLYMIESTRKMTLAALNIGEKPSVASGICKYNITNYARLLGLCGLDIHGGKAICLGPKNYLGRDYQAAPISITVEGANILTRSLIVFGQGAVRCHPFMRQLIDANIETTTGLNHFANAVYGFVANITSNTTRALILGLTQGAGVKTPKSSVPGYYQKLTQYSAAFAFLTDIALVSLGGRLKFMESLSGRFADCLSFLYLGSATLKNYHDEGEPASYRCVVDWMMQTVFHDLEKTMDSITRNMPNHFVGFFMRHIILPFGKRAKLPKDSIGFEIATQMQKPSALRDIFSEDMYLEPNVLNPAGILCTHLQEMIDVEPLLKCYQKAVKNGDIDAYTFEDGISQALKKNILTEEEKNKILASQLIRNACNAVDDFAPEEIGTAK
jgi:acyl-CoA dehydrogenase